MAQPGGSTKPSDFPYGVVKTNEDPYNGEYLYISSPIPRMPTEYQDGNVNSTRGQKISLKRQVSVQIAGRELHSEWCFEEHWEPGTITSPYKYKDEPVKAHEWQTEDECDNYLSGNAFFHPFWHGSKELNPRVLEGCIHLYVNAYASGIDGCYWQMTNDKDYNEDHTDAKKVEIQPRKVIVGTKRRYIQYYASTANQVADCMCHSINKMAYEATRWTFAIPFFGGYSILE